jgi:hypothetical protein
MDGKMFLSRHSLGRGEENDLPAVLPPGSIQKSSFYEHGGNMAAEIGTWVKWTTISPTRLGYKATDIGKVVAIHSRSGGHEIDVQFADGDVIRGAFEQWFEKAELQKTDEASTHVA